MVLHINIQNNINELIEELMTHFRQGIAIR